jgi:hypothetical protein
MFDLAREVFHCPVGEMLDRVTSAELSEWMAYFRVEEEDREREKEGRR